MQVEDQDYAGWEQWSLTEREAGRCSNGTCMFSKLSLGKYDLILKCIPLASSDPGLHLTLSNSFQFSQLDTQPPGFSQTICL